MRSAVAVLALTLAVFAGAVVFVTLRLRSGLQGQALRRESDILAAVAEMQLEAADRELAGAGVNRSPVALLSAALKASSLRGVVSVRVFDQRGSFVGGVPAAKRKPAGAAPRALLEAAVPSARLHMETVPDFAVSPLVEIWAPLRRPNSPGLAGAAQFWIDGRPVAAEFREIDRRLGLQAGAAWAAGAALISFLLAGAYRRLASARSALERRGEDLLRANRELALAAKTSALGAVTAHLFHEIRRPLAGLEGFVGERMGRERADGEEWEAAVKLARGLRTSVDNIVQVLRDEECNLAFEMSGAEIVEQAAARIREIAVRRGVRVETRSGAGPSLRSSRANLTGLILHNLLANACEASSAGSVVTVSCGETDRGDAVFEVEDRGPGLPQQTESNPFRPIVSAKPGGGGVGLAISQQLARHAGARLELVRTGPGGTCFRVHFSEEAEAS